MPKRTDEEKERPALWQKEWQGEQKIEKTAVSNDALAMINRLTPEPVTQDDVWTGKMKLANDQYDRDDERFPVPVLNRFRDTIVGKSVMVAHDYSTKPVGRYYDAEVRKDADGHHLLASFFMDADGADTPAVKKGIMGHVSIGFQPDQRTCDICGKDYDGWYKSVYSSDRPQADDDPCGHIKGRMYDGQKCTVTYGGDMQKTEAQEGSFVWLGCQRGAEMTRSIQQDDTRKAAHFEQLGAKAISKETQVDEKEKAAAAEREKALQSEIDQMKPLAADGEAFRKHQKDEIGRLYSSMGEAETGAALLKLLDGADAATLDGVRKEADDRHAKHFARGGADLARDEPDAEPKPKRSIDQILFGGE